LGRPGSATDVGLRERHAAGRCRPTHVPDGRQRGVAHTWPRPTLLGKSRRPRVNAWGVRVTRGMPRSLGLSNVAYMTASPYFFESTNRVGLGHVWPGVMRSTASPASLAYVSPSRMSAARSSSVSFSRPCHRAATFQHVLIRDPPQRSRLHYVMPVATLVPRWWDYDRSLLGV
jgi:hypothetical protein